MEFPKNRNIHCYPCNPREFIWIKINSQAANLMARKYFANQPIFPKAGGNVTTQSPHAEDGKQVCGWGFLAGAPHTRSPGGLSTGCSRHGSPPPWCAVIFHRVTAEVPDYHRAVSLPKVTTPLGSFYLSWKSLPSAAAHDLAQVCPTAIWNWIFPCSGLLGCFIMFLFRFLHVIGFSKFLLLCFR